jgi:hypothetical protein
MTLRPLALALAFVTMTCSPGRPAFAETEAAPAPAACGAYRELAETLRQRYGETLRFRAEENRGFALEFFAHDGGSWTLVMRRDEEACAIAAGTAWRAGTDIGL